MTHDLDADRRRPDEEEQGGRRFGGPALFASALGCLGLLALGIAPAPVRAQEPDAGTGTAASCSAPEHRAFDFWIGTWEVRDSDGEIVGHNAIRRVAGGCGLLEEWRGRRGGTGVSINMYEPARDAWTQTWVGEVAILHLAGGFRDGRMVLTGEAPRRTSRGEVLDRITWTPQEDGRVRQEWQVSPDRGDTWRTIFVGLYSRSPPP